jgi:DNA-binding NarL/FixJ family response regulator
MPNRVQPLNPFDLPNPKAESMNVFLVDDSAIIRERLKRMLAMVEEVAVTGEAGGVQTALDAISSLKTDVVLLGLPFCHGSGLALLQRLKKAEPAPTVIILTDDPYPLYRQKCLEAKADFVFVKSTEFDQVIPLLKQLVQQARDDVRTSARVTA